MSEGADHMKAAVRKACPNAIVCPSGATGYVVVNSFSGKVLGGWASEPDRAWHEAYKLMMANRP